MALFSHFWGRRKIATLQARVLLTACPLLWMVKVKISKSAFQSSNRTFLLSQQTGWRVGFQTSVKECSCNITHWHWNQTVSQMHAGPSGQKSHHSLHPARLSVHCDLCTAPVLVVQTPQRDPCMDRVNTAGCVSNWYELSWSEYQYSKIEAALYSSALSLSQQTVDSNQVCFSEVFLYISRNTNITL